MAEQAKKKRKRGGLAGLWDRNKNVIKPLATLAAGALTGGAGAAILGGAMGGLDRPGKGGVGFDVGGAAKGAISGYGMGQIGQAAGSKLGSLFGAKASTGAGAMGVEPAISAPASSMSRNAAFETASPLGTVPVGPASAPESRLSQMFTGAQKVAKNVGGFAKENASWLGPAATSAATFASGSQAADVREQELELEREKFRRQTAQQDALAQLLNPMFQAQAQRVGTGYRG